METTAPPRVDAAPLTLPTTAPLLRLVSAAGPLVVSALAIAYASFLETDPTRNDFERFTDQRLLIVFLGLVVAFGLAYVRNVVQPVTLSRRAIVAVALLLLAAMLISAPVGSRDTYLYSGYGHIGTAHGLNAYVRAITDFVNDPWLPYIQMESAQRHMIYGPLFYWESRIVTALAGDNIFYAVWMFKALGALMLLVVWYLAARLDSEVPSSSADKLLLLAWNPLLLFELVGNGHNDGAMVLLLVTALWCWHRERFALAVTLVALSFWYKWYGLLVLPAFLLAGYKQAGVRTAVRLAEVAALAVLVGGTVALGFLPGATEVLVGELFQPFQLTQIYPTELSPVLAPWFWMLQLGGMFQREYGMQIFHAGRTVAFVAAVAAILVRQWRQPPSTRALVESACLLTLAFPMLIITILWPWHLAVPIALAVLTGRRAFITVAVGLSMVGLLSYFLTFSVAALGVVLIVGVLAFLRRNQPSTTSRPLAA